MQLEFCESYRFHTNLKLRNGRRITLDTLNQRRTYGGTMVGVPHRQRNDETIKRAVYEAKKPHIVDFPVHVITPGRRPYMINPGDQDRYLKMMLNHVRHVPEWLPPVQCTAQMTHLNPVRDQSECYSLLMIIWFQEEFAMPIQESELAKILDLDWDNLAMDCTD